MLCPLFECQTWADKSVAWAHIVDDPLIWLIVVASFLIGGFIKGITGVGLPLVAVPAIAAYAGVHAAVVIVGIPSIISNFWQVWSFRSEAPELTFLPEFLISGVVGIGVGTALLVRVPEALLALGLSLLLVCYITLRLSKPDIALTKSAAKTVAAPVGFATGLLQGFTGIAAPIGVTFFLSLRAKRLTYLFATSSMFLIFAIAQLVSTAISGLVTVERLLQGTAGAAAALVALPLGSALGRRLSTKTFDKLILALLAMMATQLMIEAMVKL